MTDKPRRRNNSRGAILDAAQRVAVNKGANKVSLDSVAKEAGLTKGGVLYNFSGKDALMTALLERLVDTYKPLVETRREELAGEKNATLRSVIQVIQQLQQLDHNIPMAILAAGAENLDLLQPLRAEMARRQQQIRDEAEDPDQASLIWAAGEGMMLMDMLGLLPFDEEKRQQLFQRLDEAAEGVRP
ncbi:TetR/AcrR family transcriptional regulator [Marinospirillum perlucidum]|uniref:TetR/AcrR family transcriptional regulator n=1 Tax=Marinospirillum perlucidum TaxID=1982602 RepID=UPI000DF24F67|nr:TetR/AcrR family transcriptional regulator [Marinospirillum perlucidum]